MLWKRNYTKSWTLKNWKLAGCPWGSDCHIYQPRTETKNQNILELIASRRSSRSVKKIVFSPLDKVLTEWMGLSVSVYPQNHNGYSKYAGVCTSKPNCRIICVYSFYWRIIITSNMYVSPIMSDTALWKFIIFFYFLLIYKKKKNGNTKQLQG